MTDVALTNDAVVRFLNRFEEIAEQENFDLIQHMVHDNAVFRFNDGDFVGKQAVRGAFEKTWKGSANGRGTRVLVVENGQLQTIHEHLGRFPKP